MPRRLADIRLQIHLQDVERSRGGWGNEGGRQSCDLVICFICPFHVPVAQAEHRASTPKELRNSTYFIWGCFQRPQHNRCGFHPTLLPGCHHRIPAVDPHPCRPTPPLPSAAGLEVTALRWSLRVAANPFETPEPLWMKKPSSHGRHAVPAPRAPSVPPGASAAPRGTLCAGVQVLRSDILKV